MVFPYNGILLSNKKRWLWACCNVDESHNYSEWKKPERPKKKLYAVWFPLHNILEKCKLTYTHGKSVQLSSVTQLCPTLCDPMNRSKPGLPVHHQLPEFTQTHVHWVGDAIQPSHPLSSHFPPALNLSQHQGIFKWISSSHQVAKVLEFQLHHQSFQWILRIDFL